MGDLVMHGSVDRTQYEAPLRAYYEARTTGAPDLAQREAEALEANLGIARAFARGVKGRPSLSDIEAAATLGLFEAMRKWTPEGGANLWTWAQGPMRAAVRKVQESTSPVRVAIKTLRAAREIAESGEDVDAACARLGKRPQNIKAALSVRSCELTPDHGATSMEESVFEAEMQAMLAGAGACWRDASGLLRAAESLAQRRAEILSGEDTTDEQRAIAEALWPTSAEDRVHVLARLDYALTVAHRERSKPRAQRAAVADVECWRQHFVGGQLWTEIGVWLGGVSRTRAQFRAKRAESAISKALTRAAEIPSEALELWARRPVEVVELERLGVLGPESDPLTVLYAVEDLEVALTEIDGRLARVWSARAKGQSWAELAAAESVGRKTVRAWASRADAALRQLLQVAGEVEQLELFTAAVSTWTQTSWWSPLAKEAASTITNTCARLRSATRRGLASVARRFASTVQRWAEPVTALGSNLLSGLADCTGPPDAPRPNQMILRLQC